MILCRLVAQTRQKHIEQTQQQQQAPARLATAEHLRAATPDVDVAHPLLALNSQVLAAITRVGPDAVPKQKHPAGPQLGLKMRKLLQQEARLTKAMDGTASELAAATRRGKKKSVAVLQRKGTKRAFVQKRLKQQEQSLMQTLAILRQQLEQNGVSMEQVVPSAEELAAGAGVGAVLGKKLGGAAAAADGGDGGKKGSKQKKAKKPKLQAAPQQRKAKRKQQHQQAGQQQGEQQQVVPRFQQGRKLRAHERWRQQRDQQGGQQQQHAGGKRRRGGAAAAAGGGGRGWGYDD